MPTEQTIGLIYETVADPSLWREVVRGIASQVDASAAWMFQPGPAGPKYFALQGISDAVVRGYVEYYHRKDILVIEGARREAELAGKVVRECDIVDETAWLRSEIYNDLGRPNGIGHLLTVPLTRIEDDRLPPILTFFSPAGRRVVQR